ncbi:MAG: ATP-binding protein [Chloroflexota bacterium]|nr:ATP-binding protein [Chloroflexota bacterium]
MMTNGPGGLGDDALRASLAHLYEHGPCGYLFTRMDGMILQANQTLLNWAELELGDLVGQRRFQDLLTLPGKLFYENQFFPLLRLQGAVREVAFDLARRGREPLPVLVSSVLHSDTDGTPPVVASAIFNASDRRAYEQELLRSRRSAEQLAAIVRLSSDAIVGMSPEGVIQTWNDGATRMFGYTESEIAGTNLSEILAPADSRAAWFELLAELQEGRPNQLEMVGRGAHGKHVDVSAGFTPHRGLLGAVESVSVIMRDIAERRAVERVQQEFLAVTAHELRSPVTGIKGNAQLMKRREAYSERSIEAIISQADRLERLINDLLLASQVHTDRLDLALEELDLASAARVAIDNLGVSDSTVQVETPPQPVVVRADAHRLNQVVANLLTNAIKYSPAGAEVTVRVTRTEDEAHLSVEDRGVGIPPDALPRLFDRFYRASGTTGNVQGLGLGLYISRRIVDAHGGRIEVASEVGRGSTFTMMLPIGGPPSEQAQIR